MIQRSWKSQRMHFLLINPAEGWQGVQLLSIETSPGPGAVQMQLRSIFSSSESHFLTLFFTQQWTTATVLLCTENGTSLFSMLLSTVAKDESCTPSASPSLQANCYAIIIWVTVVSVQGRKGWPYIAVHLGLSISCSWPEFRYYALNLGNQVFGGHGGAISNALPNYAL